MLIIIIIIFALILYLNINQYDYFSETQKITKYKMTIMAIFKNEELYLEEWLTHHIGQGVDHFYLFSNDNNMDKYPYLDKYKNYVTLIPWTNKFNEGPDTIQRQAYTHCIQNYNNEYKYIMMLDIDEFLISLDNNKAIDVILSLNNNIKSIKVQRYDFGSDSHVSKPLGNVMDNYKKHEKICSSYKTIANSDYIDTSKKFYGVHDFPFLNKEGKVYNAYFDYKYSGYPNGCDINSVNEIPLVINHYYTKSYSEYLKRCELWKQGGVNTVGYRKDCEKLFRERDKSEVENY